MTKAKPKLNHCVKTEVAAAVISIAVDQAAWGQASVAEELRADYRRSPNLANTSCGFLRSAPLPSELIELP